MSQGALSDVRVNRGACRQRIAPANALGRLPSLKLKPDGWHSNTCVRVGFILLHISQSTTHQRSLEARCRQLLPRALTIGLRISPVKVAPADRFEFVAPPSLLLSPGGSFQRSCGVL